MAPENLLIDEVLSAGDVEFKDRSTERIKQMVKQAGSVIVASHSLGMVQQLCTRAILMDRGRIRMSGPPAEVVAAYLGEQKELVARRGGAAAR
jgi:teichoic acid transport system ATP-binding protein